MSVLWVQSGKHTLPLSFSGFDSGCVKTCTRGECAELFSLFSSFDGARQSGSFLIRRNRDKRSTRKFDVGVFTQPRSKPDVSATRVLDRNLNSFNRPVMIRRLLGQGGGPGQALRSLPIHGT